MSTMTGRTGATEDDAADCTEQGARSGGQIGRAVALLEGVATRGSCSAKDLAERTGIPLPTVYRMANELVKVGYLVHLRDEKRYALGYKLHKLATRLHEDLGIPASVRREVHSLHEDLGMASYLAIHRGAEFVVVHVSDGPTCPRLRPMDFGFADAPHATAFGKLGLSELSPAERSRVLPDPLPRLTASTIVTPDALTAELTRISESGLAWEHGEFMAGADCLAAPIRAGDGTLLGSVAVSAPAERYLGRRRHVEDRVRTCAARASRLYRAGTSRRGA